MTDPKLPTRLEAYDAEEAAYGWAIDAKDAAKCFQAGYSLWMNPNPPGSYNWRDELAAMYPTWTGVDMAAGSDFTAEFQLTERDFKLHELAQRYHAETEAYDRTVCTGPVVRGSIQPLYPWEMAAINRNASQVFARLLEEAKPHGITRAELWRLISRL